MAGRPRPPGPPVNRTEILQVVAGRWQVTQNAGERQVKYNLFRTAGRQRKRRLSPDLVFSASRQAGRIQAGT